MCATKFRVFTMKSGHQFQGKPIQYYVNEEASTNIAVSDCVREEEPTSGRGCEVDSANWPSGTTNPTLEQGVAEIWSSLVDVSSRNPNQNNDLPAKPLFQVTDL